jgi:hypothetical protein
MPHSVNASSRNSHVHGLINEYSLADDVDEVPAPTRARQKLFQGMVENVLLIRSGKLPKLA